jgi:hypothetical protein
MARTARDPTRKGATVAGKSDRLTNRARAFVTQRAIGQTVEAAAEAIGLSPRQAWRYAANPVIRAAILEAQNEQLGDATRALGAGTRHCLGILRMVMDDKGTPPMVRLRAVDIWLNNRFRAFALADMEQRLTELERRQNEH